MHFYLYTVYGPTLLHMKITSPENYWQDFLNVIGSGFQKFLKFPYIMNSENLSRFSGMSFKMEADLFKSMRSNRS